MKKKITALLCLTALVIGIFCTTVFAAPKPSFELMNFTATIGSSSARNPVMYFRNNSTKTIRYIDWYVTACDRVNGPASFNATRVLTTVGPVEPFKVNRNSNAELKEDSTLGESSPFRYYKETSYQIAIGDNRTIVFQDAYDNFFVMPNASDNGSLTYLTEDEINSAMFQGWCSFPDVAWYSNVVDHLTVDKVVITYMDGSTETITQMGSKYRSMQLQNRPFAQQLAQYQAVYNYQDYLNCNPDLAAQFGANQKALFEHFIASGMKEGRQGSAEFNLSAYKANNPDLVAAFGDDNVKYYEHYISQGKAEGRVAV